MITRRKILTVLCIKRAGSARAGRMVKKVAGIWHCLDEAGVWGGRDVSAVLDEWSRGTEVLLCCWQFLRTNTWGSNLPGVPLAELLLPWHRGMFQMIPWYFVKLSNLFSQNQWLPHYDDFTCFNFFWKLIIIFSQVSWGLFLGNYLSYSYSASYVWLRGNNHSDFHNANINEHIHKKCIHSHMYTCICVYTRTLSGK